MFEELKNLVIILGFLFASATAKPLFGHNRRVMSGSNPKIMLNHIS